jgi:hypothetical protein
MPDGLDPYKTLQVDPEAEDEVIQAAYRRLARKYHPDLTPGEEAATRMAAINAAWELIGDPAARAGIRPAPRDGDVGADAGGESDRSPVSEAGCGGAVGSSGLESGIRTRPTATRDRLARLDVGAVVVRWRLRRIHAPVRRLRIGRSATGTAVGHCAQFRSLCGLVAG